MNPDRNLINPGRNSQNGFFFSKFFLNSLYCSNVSPSSDECYSLLCFYGFTIDKDVCSNTNVLNRSFCLNFLDSNPVVIRSVLHGLAEATIDVASSNATKTSQLIIKWQSQTDNPQLKNAISQCSTSYNKAIADLKEAREKVQCNDYVALQRAAVDASIEFHACNEKFEDIPPDSTPLSSTSSELAAISSILIAVF